LKSVLRELHKYNIHGRAAIAKPLFTQSSVQIRKRRRHDHKTWISDNWKRRRDMVSELSFTLFPTSGMWGRFYDGLGSNIVVEYSVFFIINLHGRITAREYVGTLGNQVYPVIQT
jgi:hypothetical protein